MARLHPSNSLPKVLDVLHEVAELRPQCRLGLVIYEAEQAWSALTILNMIIELKLKLVTLEYMRAFFPVETLIQAATSCGLERLTLDHTQVSITRSADHEDLLIWTLKSLTISNSVASPGLLALISAAEASLTHLDISGIGEEDTELELKAPVCPRLTHLRVDEEILPILTDAKTPMLRSLRIRTLTQIEGCEVIRHLLTPEYLPLRDVRVEKVEADVMSDALARLSSDFPSATVAIRQLAIREASTLTTSSLGIAENLVNAGPPIKGDWPFAAFSGDGKRQYPRLKSIVLKVLGESNVGEFIAGLDAPNLECAAKVEVVGRRKGKGGKK